MKRKRLNIVALLAINIVPTKKLILTLLTITYGQPTHPPI